MRMVGNHAKRYPAPIILHSAQQSTIRCSTVQQSLIRLLDKSHHSETTCHLHFSNGIKPCNIKIRQNQSTRVYMLAETTKASSHTHGFCKICCGINGRQYITVQNTPIYITSRCDVISTASYTFHCTKFCMRRILRIMNFQRSTQTDGVRFYQYTLKFCSYCLVLFVSQFLIFLKQ